MSPKKFKGKMGSGATEKGSTYKPPENKPCEELIKNHKNLVYAHWNPDDPQKTCAIRGDIGSHLGAFMRSGRLDVGATVGKYTGLGMVGGILIISPGGGNLRNDLCIDDYLGSFMMGGIIRVIHGPVGNNIGHQMMNGRIEIQGATGDLVGSYMNDGEIIIHGKTGSFVGAHMKGGVIIVNGGVGDYAGMYASGGELRVKGEIGSNACWGASPKFKITKISVDS